jgi:hypothetical protein
MTKMTTGDDDTTPDSVQTSTPDVPPAVAGAWDRADYQRIWLGTQSRAWQTLAVVPVDERVSTYEVANLITTLGLHHGESVSVADLRDVRLSRVGAFLEAAGELVKRGQRVVYATCSIRENLATIPLARAADAVILCVSIGASMIGSIEDAIEQIGKERFLGSMLIKAPGAGVRAPARQPRALSQMAARS